MNDIISFIEDNGTEYHKRMLPMVRRYILMHMFYKTCTVLHDDKGILAISRWNIKDDTADILDVILRKDVREKSKGIETMKELLRHSRKGFQDVKYIRYKRESREDYRMRKYKIEDLLNGR